MANGGISKDGRTIIYHLRPGVRWQDGAPFTADDVVFAWHAVMNPSNALPSRVSYEVGSSIEKRNDHLIAATSTACRLAEFSARARAHGVLEHMDVEDLTRGVGHRS